MTNIGSFIKRNKENIIVIILILLVISIFLMNSPLHPMINGESSIDSSVFRLIGLMMKKGYMPYRDTFDHKGPLLYLINYVAALLSEKNGVWYIELVWLSITLFVMYKTARLLCKSIVSMCISIFSFSLLYNFYQAGNSVEEYALPFIAISLYIFIDYFINNKVTKSRLIICGACFACVFMLRQNMIATWIAMCLGVLVKLLIEKNYKDIWDFLLWFSVGAAIIIVPISLWLIIEDSFKTFIYDYFIFNFKYTAVYGEETNTLLYLFVYYGNNIQIIISSLIMVIAIVTKRKLLYISYIICLLLNMLFVCISRNGFEHYGAVLVPLTVFPLSLMFLYFSKTKLEILSPVLALLLLIFSISSYVNIISKFNKNINNTELIDSDIVKIKEFVNKATTLNDRIAVCGNRDYIYIYCDRLPSSRYSYQIPIANVDGTIWNQFFKDILNENTKVVIVDSYYLDRINQFLKTNGYYEADILLNGHKIYQR